MNSSSIEPTNNGIVKGLFFYLYLPKIQVRLCYLWKWLLLRFIFDDNMNFNWISLKTYFILVYAMSYIVNQYSIYIMTLHIQTCIAFLIAIFILLNIFFFFQFKSHYTKNIFPIVFAYCIQLCSFQNRPYLKSFF